MFRMSEEITPFQLRTLGECVEVLDRLRKPINSDARRDRKGNIPYYGANGQVGTIDEWIFDEDLVLVAEDGGFFEDSLRPISYRISGKSWVNNHAHVLRPINGLDIDWLNYSICCQDIRHLIKGATLKKLNQADLLKILVPFPSPDVQHRVVTRIKECMTLVDEIEEHDGAIPCELNAVFPAILRERFLDLKMDNPVEVLEDVTDIRGGQSLPSGSTEDHGDKSVLLVKVGDMNAGGNERNISSARAYLRRAEAGHNAIPAGAVIFPKRGGAIATNKKRILGRDAMLDPNLMAVVAKPDRILPGYLYYWCLTLKLSDLSNGGVIPQLNRKDLAPLKLPVPDFKQQQLIIDELEEAETACFELRQEFDSASKDRQFLRESILRKAFAGEL